MSKNKSVSVVVPCLTEHEWQVHLTRAIISIARSTTEIKFELVITEAVGNYFVAECDFWCVNKSKGYANADMNSGMDKATGEIIVILTNDVFVKPGWLEALLQCFDISDCGMASLGTSDHREESTDMITEGLWCPLMALLNRPDFRFDDQMFPSYWGDSDLVMKVYNAGFRAYRNRRIICDHLGRATNTKDHVRGRAEEIEAAKQKFITRHGTSNLLIYRVLMDGLIV